MRYVAGRHPAAPPSPPASANRLSRLSNRALVEIGGFRKLWSHKLQNGSGSATIREIARGHERLHSVQWRWPDHPEPAIAGRLQKHATLVRIVRTTVILGQQIDQQAARWRGRNAHGGSHSLPQDPSSAAGSPGARRPARTRRLEPHLCQTSDASGNLIRKWEKKINRRTPCPIWNPAAST